MQMQEATIAAIATAMAPSGIGIIRISGPDALTIGDRIFQDLRHDQRLSAYPAGALRHGRFVQIPALSAGVKETDGKENTEKSVSVPSGMLDEGMAVYFQAPHSYTGEDMVELHCHGGLLVQKRVLESVLAAGARLAQPGEFSKRAFLNGRMDLSQAEAVMDLISADNDRALFAATRQLSGRLSGRIRSIRKELLTQSAFIEAALDDPESFAGELDGYATRLDKVVQASIREIRQLLSSADLGILARNGVRTAIIGRPNVGKSSLLNLLTGHDRAIVSEISGTTRDTVEESVRLGDLTLHLIDTAGLADEKVQTPDTVEAIGISRSLKAMEEAQLILFVFDVTKPVEEEMLAFIREAKDRPHLVIANKIDLCTPSARDAFAAAMDPETTLVWLSAKTGEGLETFSETVSSLLIRNASWEEEDLLIASERHKQLLIEAERSLCSLMETIGNGLSEDFYTVDLLSAYRALGEIIGEEVTDDLVEEIFSRFCMGK